MTLTEVFVKDLGPMVCSSFGIVSRLVFSVRKPCSFSLMVRDAVVALTRALSSD